MGFVIFCTVAPTLYFLYKYIVHRDEERAKQVLEEIEQEKADYKEAS